MTAILERTAALLLLNLGQLAAGCLLAWGAGALARRGVRFSAVGWRGMAAMGAVAALGVVLPLGGFGLAPVAAALVLLGCTPAQALPALVSGLIFNMAEPLTQPTFLWSGNAVRVGVALAAGVLAGALAGWAFPGERLLRPTVQQRLFCLQRQRWGWPALLRDGVDTLGLALAIGALAAAVLDGGLFYWLQTRFFASEFGSVATGGIARFNVFHPVFVAGGQTLLRFTDPLAVACVAVVLRGRAALALGLYLLIVSLLLFVGLFL